MMMLADFAGRVPGMHWVSRTELRGPCPLCGGRSRNCLSIKDGAHGVLAHCFKCGADGRQIAAAVGVPIAELFHQPRAASSPRRPMTAAERRRAEEQKQAKERCAERYQWLDRQYRETVKCLRWLDRRSAELAEAVARLPEGSSERETLAGLCGESVHVLVEHERALREIDREMVKLERGGCRRRFYSPIYGAPKDGYRPGGGDALKERPLWTDQPEYTLEDVLRAVQAREREPEMA